MANPFRVKDLKASGVINGDGSEITHINADELSSGTVPKARLGSGTPSSTTYLRGDGTWATVEVSIDGLNTTEKEVTQIGHGLSLGDVIRMSTVANNYVKALADNAVNAEVIGYVTKIIDVDHFSYISFGYTEINVPDKPVGSVVFLSDVTPGALTDLEPTTLGRITKPLAIIMESSVSMQFINMRGLTVTMDSLGGSSGNSSSDELYYSSMGM